MKAVAEVAELGLVHPTKRLAVLPLPCGEPLLERDACRRCDIPRCLDPALKQPAAQPRRGSPHLRQAHIVPFVESGGIGDGIDTMEQ